MAESYIITIKFTPSNASLKEAEGKLTKTFNRVTNGFKKGFNKVWKGMKIGAGVTAMATAVSALLNPMSELNDRINQTLDKASNIKDRAAGADTDIKSYLALQGYAKSKGVSEETLSGAIARVQTLVGEAKNGQDNALYEYRNETDMGKVFYNVMNQLSKLQGPERAALAAEIFGRNAVTSLGPLVTEGFNQDTFNKLLKGIDLGAVEKSVYNLDDRANEQAVLAFKRDMQDMVAKGRVITPDTIKMQDAAERARIKNENTRLKSYESVAMIDISLKQLLGVVSGLVIKLEPALVLLAGALQVVIDIPKCLDILWNNIRRWRPWGSK